MSGRIPCAIAAAMLLAVGVVPAAEVTIDDERMCPVVDGEPFFAIGCCGIPPQHMQEAADAGFNLSIRYRDILSGKLEEGIEEDEARIRAIILDYYKAAEAAGLRVVERPDCDYVDLHYYSIPNYTARFERFVERVLPWIVDTVKDQPALLGYYGPDEAESGGSDEGWRDQLRAYSEKIRSHDPRHPIYFLFCSTILEWPECYDIIGLDWYPRQDEIPLIGSYHYASRGSATAHRLGCPYWHIPLMEVFSNSCMRPIGPAQQRAQTYLAIIGGADGIVWWIWPARHIDNWNMIKQLATEMRALTPVLVEPPQHTNVRWDPPELHQTVQVRAIRHETSTWLLVANACETPAQIRLALPADVQGPVLVWFEEREIGMEGRILTDRIEGYGRHVYEVPGQWPEGAEIVLNIELDSDVPEPPPIHVRDPLAPNLIWDPGFESELFWTLSRNKDGPEQVQARFDYEVSHGGQWSALIERDGATSNSTWTGRAFRLKPDTGYAFGGWLRTQMRGQSWLRFRLDVKFGLQAGAIANRLALYPGDWGPWRQYCTAFFTGEHSVTVCPMLSCRHASCKEQEGADGRIWMDDLFLVEAAPQVRNMVVNGGFEGPEVAHGWPRGWWSPHGLLIPGHVGGEDALWGLDDNEAWEGSRSLRMTNPYPPDRPYHLEAAARQTMAVIGGLAAGRNYVLSAWMKADRGDMSVWLHAGGVNEKLQVSDEWHRYDVHVCPKRTALTPYVIIWPADEGTLWLDAVQLELGSEATEYREWSE